MKEERTRKFLEQQLKLAGEREKALIEQVKLLLVQNAGLAELNLNLSGQIQLLSVQVNELKQTVESLQEALLQKSRDISSLSGKNLGLTKLLKKSSEKVTPTETDSSSNHPEKKPYNPKERGNNGAKRKNHINLEEVVIDIWPDNPEFDREKAK